MKKNNRAAVDLGVVVVIAAVLAVVGLAKKFEVFGGSKTQEVVNAQEAAAKKAKADEANARALDQKKDLTAEAITLETKKQTQVAQEATVATGKAIEAAQATTNAGGLPVKELAAASTLNKLATDALDQAVGSKVLAARVIELETMARGLIEDKKESKEEVTRLRTRLETSAVREANLVKDLQIQTDAAIKARKEADASSEAREIAVKDLTKTALERDSLATTLQNVKFWGIVVFGGLFFLWIAGSLLPVIAQFFPALASLSNVFTGVINPGLHYVKTKAETGFKDMVGALDDSKKFIAEIDPTKVEKYKKDVLSAWSTVEDGTAAMVSRIRKKQDRI